MQVVNIDILVLNRSYIICNVIYQNMKMNRTSTLINIGKIIHQHL